MCMWENFTHFDPYDKESVEGTLEFFNATYKYGLEKGLGPGMEKQAIPNDLLTHHE